MTITGWRCAPLRRRFESATAKPRAGGLMDMAEKSFTFVRGAGSPLSGRLEPPEGTPRGWAIFAHCFTCGKDSRAAVYISRALSRAGIGVLRFDFAPHSPSKSLISLS
ncbi:MAG: hypothetical protein APF82_01330 [Sphingomonadales bacterium BRH_c42]|nr:MAG: hypothetical protein APF82_01330 [Sphingomonadales bacterium BRH_c42]